MNTEQAPVTNAGWFRPGDSRINREGRPKKGSGRATDVCASYADRLMLLPIAQRELIHRLTHERSFWLVNLPRDFEVIDCHVVKDRILFVIRSMSFPRVARGAPILEFQPEFNGRKWLPG